MVWVVNEIDAVTEIVYSVSVVSGKHSQLLGDSQCSQCNHVINVVRVVTVVM